MNTIFYFRLTASAIAAGTLFFAGCSPYATLRHDPEDHVHGATTPEFAEVKQAFSVSLIRITASRMPTFPTD